MFFKLTVILLTVLFLTFNIAGAVDKVKKNEDTPAEKIKNDSIKTIDVPFQTIIGEETCLDKIKAKAYLLVNVASRCGFTKQYEQLEELYRRYRDRGLVVIGFPANNFGSQEPGTNEEILNFCTSRFDVTFPMMSKISVKGEDKHQLYVYLTEKSAFPGEIPWNFTKFLLDKNGTVTGRFDPQTGPLDKDLVAKIEELLK
ncbi:MAG: glutathione peroxidase [candidate division Zixibacteria bacterium]|nr:glutathione peroxidase [candidate division Zixibacteria bacterium]